MIEAHIRNNSDEDAPLEFVEKIVNVLKSLEALGRRRVSRFLFGPVTDLNRFIGGDDSKEGNGGA